MPALYYMFTLAHSRSMIATIGFPTLAKNICGPTRFVPTQQGALFLQAMQTGARIGGRRAATTRLRNSFALRRNKSVIDDDMGSRKDARDSF